MEFKDALRKRRESMALSPEGLAARLSWFGAPATAADIQLWERGRNSPPLENPVFREALAAALQIPVEKIERSMRLTQPPAPSRSDEAMRAADLIDQMPVHLRSMALNVLEAMLRSPSAETQLIQAHDFWDE